MLSASTALRTTFVFFKVPNPGLTDTRPTCHLTKYRKASFYLAQQPRERQTGALTKRTPTKQIFKDAFRKAIYWFLGDPPKPWLLITNFKMLEQLSVQEVSDSRQ